MASPKIYYIKPRVGWNWVDRVMTSLINPIGAALAKFRQSGYAVVEKDGCTQDELLHILSRSDTYGVIVASHAHPGGICLDLPPDVQEARERAGTLTLWGDIFRPEEINVRASPNLQFAVFFGCNISEKKLAQYAVKLGLPRANVHSTTVPGGEDYNFNLGRVAQKAYGGLSVHPRAPDAGVPGPKDAGPPAGVGYHLVSPGYPGAPGISPKRPTVFQRQLGQEAARRARENAQRLAQEAARRARENARRQAQEEAERRRTFQDAQRRAQEEAQRRRAQQEAERRRAQEEAQRRAREEAQRRQRALEQARMQRGMRPIVRPRIWAPPLKTHVIIGGPPHIGGVPMGGDPRPDFIMKFKRPW